MHFIPTTEKEKSDILASIGVEKFEELVKNIPKKGLFSPAKDGILKEGLSEMEVLSQVKALSEKNLTADKLPMFLGAGAYRHFIPSVVNSIISRGEFLTAYTPYQAEASQGSLQATFEFQTMICELYGMDVANASLYDGGSATAEAALLAVRETGRSKILVSGALHPEYRQTIRTYCRNVDIQTIPFTDGTTSISEMEKLADSNTACIIIQNPNFFGCLENAVQFVKIAQKCGALSIISSNPIALGLIQSPGECGADIAVGEGQPLGIPLNYGGPYLGLFACKEKYLRKIPGRLVGMTKDANGKRGFTLTLQTREQHIRREKATSNICSNEALMALASCVYMSLLGPSGLAECAELNLKKAHFAAEAIAKIPGFSLAFKAPFFNEFVLHSKIKPETVRAALLKNGIIGGLPLRPYYPELSDCTLFCVTEMNTKDDLELLVNTLKNI